MLDIQITYTLREERLKRNLTTRELADISGISKTHISAIECGKTHPTLYAMCILAHAMQTDLSNLYKIHVSHM